MANSLRRHCDNYTLYIYAFDLQSYEIVLEENIPNVVVVLFENLVDEDINKIREGRDRAEFCWSMTAYIILRSIRDFELDNCTYIDADLMFFSNPNLLVDEMIRNGCSVQIVEHRFSKSLQNWFTKRLNGRFCVEFNTFLNNDEAMAVLLKWKEDCFNSCSKDNSRGGCGDQKYLDDWVEKYDCVHVLENHGGGVAPWNLCRYELISKDNSIILENKNNKNRFGMVFYHYAGLWVYDDERVNVSLYQYRGHYDNKLVQLIYGEYIKHLISERDRLLIVYNWKKTTKEDSYKFLWDKKDNLVLWRKVVKVILLPRRLFEKKFVLDKNIFSANGKRG